MPGPFANGWHTAGCHGSSGLATPERGSGSVSGLAARVGSFTYLAADIIRHVVEPVTDVVIKVAQVITEADRVQP
jgi:hypothetical protein